MNETEIERIVRLSSMSPEEREEWLRHEEDELDRQQQEKFSKMSKEERDEHIKWLYRPIGFDEAMSIVGRGSSYGRLPTLINLADNMSQEDWLKMLGEQWSGFDNVGKYLDDIFNCHHLWLDEVGPIMEMMNEQEREAYAALPDEIIIYRGCTALNKWGASWSLDRDKAERFPFLGRYHHLDERPLLVKAKIKKAHITALKLDREEEEVVCLFKRPTHISTSTAKDRRQEASSIE